MSPSKHDVPDELLSRLLANYQKSEDLIGENGLLKQLTKLLVEKALDAEMTEHLGHEKHDLHHQRHRVGELRIAQADQAPRCAPQQRSADETALSRPAQHQQAVDVAHPRLEGHAQPLYHPVRGSHASAVNRIPVTQNSAHARASWPGSWLWLLFDQALQPRGFGKASSWRVYVAMKLNLPRRGKRRRRIASASPWRFPIRPTAPGRPTSWPMRCGPASINQGVASSGLWTSSITYLLVLQRD